MRKRQIDEFQLGEIIGVGTVGTIYCAQDKQYELAVALKRLHRSVLGDPVIVARFQREMMILEKLEHPHIVTYYGGGNDDEQLFFAMELVEGGTLKDLLERTGRLSWAEAAILGTQIASALQYAHNHGIIHRDLKPANVFLSDQGEVRMGDFGIARDLHDKDISGRGITVGTAAYMSPEQIAGDEQVTGKTDLYALGCLLFEMITGRPPFQAEDPKQVFDQHHFRAPPRIRSIIGDCPEVLDNLVHRLLEKKPDSRPFSARAVQGELMDLLSQTSTDGMTMQEVGSQRLNARFELVHSLMPQRDVSWWVIGAVLGLVVAAVTLVWLVGE